MAKETLPVDAGLFCPTQGESDARLTVDATSGGVKFAAWEEQVTHIFLTVETAQCRFTLDGSAPTSTNGHILEAGDSGVWPASWFIAAKFIRTGASSAVIHASPLTASGGYQQ
jgi:hypothetical protein